MQYYLIIYNLHNHGALPAEFYIQEGASQSRIMLIRIAPRARRALELYQSYTHEARWL